MLKLDTYDVVSVYRGGELIALKITVPSDEQIDLADIVTEATGHNNKGYYKGYYFNILDYTITHDKNYNTRTLTLGIDVYKTRRIF